MGLMGNINMVVLSGRIARDPEVRATAGGTSVMGFGLAVNDRKRNQQTGQWENYANFVDCTMFGNRAEALSRILSKGMLVCVEGRLRYSAWERDGQKRSKLEVVVDELELPSRPGDRDGYPEQPAPAPQASPSPYYAPQNWREETPAQPYAGQVYDEDIPF